MKLSTLLVAAPLTVLGVVFAIANRGPVKLSLNPFDPSGQLLSVELPLFVALFLAVLLGMILAGTAVWIAQGRWRRRARKERREIVRLQRRAREQAGSKTNPGKAGPVASV